MARHWNALLAAAAVILSANVCFGEQIDNPAYKNWAKYKPGTSVTLKSDMDMGGTKNESETTMTLVEVNADKAVIETKMSMVMQGNKIDMPATKQDIPAKTEKPADAAANTKDKPDTKESSETIDVGGKSYKCKVTETTVKQDTGTTVSKVWTTEEIPGGMAKSETTMDGATKGTTKMTVSAVTIK